MISFVLKHKRSPTLFNSTGKHSVVNFLRPRSGRSPQGPKPTHVSAPDDVKERRKPSKPEEAEKEEEKKKKAGPMEIKGHGGVENGVPNGVEDGTPARVNGDADAVQSASAFSGPDAKACNSADPSPYLTDALSLGTGGVAQALLGGMAEALLALEE